MYPRLLLTTLLVAIGLVTVPAPSANAATANWVYAAHAGGTQVKSAGNLVTSDLTAQSSVTGGPSSTASNQVAAVNVGTLLRVGAVETKATGTRTATNTTLSSWARTANVSLLNGLITIDAVESRITTNAKSDRSSTYTGNTKFLGIHISGVKLPLNIPKNYTVGIPGLASITLNAVMHGNKDGQVATMGWALSVTLLKPSNGAPAGATIILNPMSQFLADVDPSEGAVLAGMAYGTRVQANVGDEINVISGRTAFIGTPFGSSNGQTLKNTTATVDVPGVLNAGAVTSTTYSTKDLVGNAEVRNSNKIVGVNLLNGLVKADAIEVTAAAKLQDGVWTQSMKMTTLNLVIAGNEIPVNVSPNTVINVANLGKVEINRQVSNKTQRVNRIDGIRITLSTAQAGLDVGAVIEISVAATQINPPN